MIQLPAPASYFPIERGLYEVAPGLKLLGFDFGNGALDQKTLQIDNLYSSYIQEKRSARRENLGKYHGINGLQPDVANAAINRLLTLLVQDNSDIFAVTERPHGVRRVENHLLDSWFDVGADGSLLAQKTDFDPPFLNTFDAIFSMLQEDGALVSTTVHRDKNNLALAPDRRNWLSMVHVCQPSHWAPLDKLGQDFLQVHAAVPGFERIARAHKQMVDAIVNMGPFVRFVWSFVTNKRLNHHPEPPRDLDQTTWRGRLLKDSVDGDSPFFLRIERQVTLGLPEVGAAWFFIRLSFIDGRELISDSHRRDQLISALQSMTPESRVYKGVASCFDHLIEVIRNGK